MGLLTKLAKRSLENPSTPLSAPDDWLFDALGSFRASSGVNVNRETALTYDAYWRCVALISGDVAKLPLCVKKITPSGKEHDFAHPSYRLLRFKGSDELMALHVKRVLTFHALAEGNGYGYIVRDRDATPLEIWPLSPMKTYPVRTNNRLWYVTQVGDVDRKLPPEDVLHIKGLSFDGMVGYSAVAKMRESLGMGLAAQNFGSIFFRNNARPNVVIKHPGRLKPEAKINLRESWERMHSGLENAHRTAILEEGMDVVTLMHNARDSQLLQLREFNRIEICNFFGVPPHKVGDNSRTSYNSLEQENEAYLDDGHGLGYWLCAWECEAWDKLLTEKEKDQLDHTVEFDRSGLLRANLTDRTNAHVAALQNGWKCPDEVRAEEGLNPRPDGKGGEFLQLLTLGPAGAPAPDPANPPADPADDDKGKKKKKQRLALPAPGGVGPKSIPTPPPELVMAHRALVADTVRRMVRRIGLHARRAANKPDKFVSWIDSLGEHREVVVQSLTPVAAAIAAASGACQRPGELDARPMAERLLADLRDDLLAASGSCTAKDLPETIYRLVHSWETSKPDALATQLLRAQEPGEALRTVDQALDILDRIPAADDQDRIAVPFPVDESFTADPEQLRQTTVAVMDVGSLTATQKLVGRAKVRSFVKNPTAWGDRSEAVTSDQLPVNSDQRGRPLPAGLPRDRSYICKRGTQLFIYDGHHRLTAAELRAIARIEVYLYTE